MYKLIIRAWNLSPVKITEYNAKLDRNESRVYQPLSYPKNNDVTYNIRSKEYLNRYINQATSNKNYKYEVEAYEMNEKKPFLKDKINWK